MELIKKIILTIALIVVVSLAFSLAVSTIYHHIMLRIEKKKITEIGTLVEVDGYKMNVYVEGENINEYTPTIVLLSGSGVTSPVHDYKILYSKLSDTYRVAVVEKFGYGYSDISGLPRDVATMVEQDRKALKAAGVNFPYILMPHSMSALEAIYWANNYPDEIAKIIGLDMAVPSSYQKNNIAHITFLKATTFFGLHRIPAFYPISKMDLTNSEYQQKKILTYKNSLSRDVYEECRVVLDNAKLVGSLAVPEIPILMFTTNLGQSAGHEEWESAQLDFASRAKNCIQIELDCGHDLHYYSSDEISKIIKEFLNNY